MKYRPLSYAAPPELILEKVNALLGDRRACVFYQRMAEHKGILIDLDAKSGPLYANMDRVATFSLNQPRYNEQEH